MTFFDELGLRAAEQLETSVGPFIALASFKRLLAAEQPTRGRAVIGALRCAMALDEEGEIERAVAAFEALDGDTISAVTYGVRLLDSGRTQLAARLCAAELSRTGSSTAAYVRARAVEAGLDAGLDSCALWGQVVEHAGARGDHRVHAHAVARWIGAWITRARRDAGAVLPRAALVAHAERAQLAEVLAEERLVILRGRLLSASAFQRASASSSLEEIARRDTAGLGGAALAMLCRHFDEMPFHLHSIEVDRVRAALKRLPDGADKTRLFEGIDAMAALASAYAAREDDASIEAAASRVARASPLAAAASARRAAAATASEPLPSLLAGAGAYDRIVATSIDALACLEGGRAAAAVGLLDAATALLSPDVPVPTSAWLAASAALDARDVEARRAGAGLIRAALARTTSLPPPPLTALAGRLAKAGDGDAAHAVLEEATRLREPAARVASAEIRREIAYAALASGDRGRALEELRRAKGLFCPS